MRSKILYNWAVLFSHDKEVDPFTVHARVAFEKPVNWFSGGLNHNFRTQKRILKPLDGVHSIFQRIQDGKPK